MVLAVYSGLLFFVYIPAIKFMLDKFDSSSYDITIFTVLVYLTWIIKPVFGYLCDFYPIFRKRITPYVVFGALMNIGVMAIASQIDLSKSYTAFMGVIFSMFTCFSLVDSAARNSPSIQKA